MQSGQFILLLAKKGLFLKKKVNRGTVCIYKRERLKVNTEFARKNAAESCLESKHAESKSLTYKQDLHFPISTLAM